MSVFQVADNTRFQVGDGGDPTEIFTTVKAVKTFGEIGTDTNLVETTNYDSNFKCFMTGVKEGKEFTIEFDRDSADATQNGLRTDAESGAERNIKIIFQRDEAGVPTVYETLDFTTIVRDFVLKGEKEESMMGMVTFKMISGVTYS